MDTFWSKWFIDGRSIVNLEKISNNNEIKAVDRFDFKFVEASPVLLLGSAVIRVYS
jgi:hypothetical protein